MLQTPYHISILGSNASKRVSSNFGASFTPPAMILLPIPKTSALTSYSMVSLISPSLSPSILLDPFAFLLAKIDLTGPPSLPIFLPLEDLSWLTTFLDIAVSQPLRIVCGGWKRDAGKI